MPETKRDEGPSAYQVGWFPRAKYQDLVFYVESDQGMNRKLFEMPDTSENRALMTQLAAPAPQPQDAPKLIETVEVSTITDRARELEQQIEMLNGSAEHCPNCPDQGWFVGGTTDGPEQVQCQFCDIVEMSVFNIKLKIADLIAASFQRERDEALRDAVGRAKDWYCEDVPEDELDWIGQKGLESLCVAILSDQPKDASSGEEP
jgi:hypothetical protein